MNCKYVVPLQPFMNAVIDIGNSRTKIVVFDGDAVAAEQSVQGHTLAHAPLLFAEHNVTDAIISSVVDLSESLTEELSRLQAQCALAHPILHFNASTPIPLHNAYRTPASLGADRLAAAVGAWMQCQGKPLLIIDAGSCITFDMVSQEGTYLGGNISPGLQARLRAIDDYFPRLPLVAAHGDLPELGYDTETAIRAGVVMGMRHEIEGYIRHFASRLPDLHVYITGGDALDLTTHPDATLLTDTHLVAKGLNCILNYNIRLSQPQ